MFLSIDDMISDLSLDLWLVGKYLIGVVEL
jgi:hypothetical protein